MEEELSAGLAFLAGAEREGEAALFLPLEADEGWTIVRVLKDRKGRGSWVGLKSGSPGGRTLLPGSEFVCNIRVICS